LLPKCESAQVLGSISALALDFSLHIQELLAKHGLDVHNLLKALITVAIV
jgi:hypothetical protein